MPFSYPTLEHRIIANSVVLPPEDPDFERYQYAGTPCWLWIGPTNSRGYPRMTLRIKDGPQKGAPRAFFAHRLVLIIFHGIFPSRKQVAQHLCNNPICVHPNHLKAGTQSENIRQCVAEGRHVPGRRK